MAGKSCLLLCYVSFVLLFPSEALPATRNLVHRLERRSGIRLCGRMLVDTLAAICQSEYYAPEHHKRNYDESHSWDSNYEGVVALEEPQTAFDLFRVNSVSRRGVADECCMKSCSIGQLFSYCGRNTGK